MKDQSSTGRHAASPDARTEHYARQSATHDAEHYAAQPATQTDARADSSQETDAASSTRSTRGRRTKQRRPNIITRTVTAWLNRVLGAVQDGSLAEQEEEYASHRTTRDYIWNALGIGSWGMVFPILTMVVTQLVGTEQAGMFSMAFVTGMLLMYIGNYGIRTFQVSDLDEHYSFSDYQFNRVATCIAMMIIGIAYCNIRGYESQMFLICMGVYGFKMVDALADVYEGRLQQVDKLYLAGVSQTLRSVSVFVVFTIVLFITRSLPAAAITMAITAIVSFVVLTFPLALLETPRSQRFKISAVAELFKQCFPLFIALFMYNLIDNMPKFVMEGVLSYDNQLYFNALYFPAHALLLVVQLVYKPQLVRLATVWADPTKRRRFDIVIVGMLLLILALTAGLALIMSTIGIPMLSILYGVDFEEFRGLAYIMVAAGGITAGIDFLYQTVTVLRRQGSVMKIYLITFGFSLFIPVLLVNFTGLPGAVIGYLIVMAILFVLLIWEYITIRLEFFQKGNKERDLAEREAQQEERTRRATYRANPELLLDPNDPHDRTELARRRLKNRGAHRREGDEEA